MGAVGGSLTQRVGEPLTRWSAVDPELIAPLGRVSAGQELADRLLAAVAVGSYLPGDRFPSERSLAATFAVSRATVREALRMLRAAAVIEVRLGRTGGAYVRALEPGAADGAVRRTVADQGPRLEQVFDLRELVESLVARTAAERRGPGDVVAMQAALARFRDAPAERERHRADQALHEAVLHAAHNSELSALSRRLLVAAALGVPVEPYADDMYRRARGEHTALVEAVAEGDAEQAAGIARAHFRISAETVRRALVGPTTPAADDVVDAAAG